MDPVRELRPAQPPIAAATSPSAAGDAASAIGAPHFAVSICDTGYELHDAAKAPASRIGLKQTVVQFLQMTFAIFAWELRSFFLRPASYLLLLAATQTAAWGFSWLVTLLSRGATVVLRHADNPIAQFLGPNVFLIGGCTLLVPLLTMNAIADERRRATWEQLLTAPVSPLAIVLGKFAAVWSLLMISLAPWLYHVVVLRIWNGRMTFWHGIPWFDGPGLTFDFGLVWGGGLGLAIVGATFVAVGLFCSGLCRGPASAAVLSLAAMGLMLLAVLAPRVLAYWDFAPAQIAFVNSVSCWGHLERFSRGTIEPRLVIGHLSVCSVLLWGTAVTCRRADGG